MAKKIEKVNVNGKALTPKEKRVLDYLNTVNEIVPSEVGGKEPFTDLTVASVRATLARLEKTHGLAKGVKKLVNDKAVTVYKKIA